MRSAQVSEASFAALSVGSAVPPGRAPLAVHSVFRSALNLRLEGSDLLVALTGPKGRGHPLGIAVEPEPDFPGLGLKPGDRGLLELPTLTVEGPAGRITVACPPAPEAREVLAPVASLGEAYLACREALLASQASTEFDLRLADLLSAEGREGKRAQARLAMASRAIALVWAASDFDLADGFSVVALAGAIRRLVGAGQGLTPSGDDFITGFLAAARAAESAWGPAAPRRPGPLATLCEMVESSASGTTPVAASQLRAAARGHFPSGLAALAEAISRDRKDAAVSALARVLDFGHSSGSDTATGFLAGLMALAPLAGRGPRSGRAM